MIRDLVWQAEDNDLDAQLQAERFAQRTAGRSPDFAEGVKAFLEKRPADFRKA
jgi:2-(1,2-epoxy-1,2-dihydrophenyl)acetyl-CoA isomerase